jgi:nucleoside 2-deoxyribosyltransferase
MNRRKLYLAGPITGLSYGESVGWREYVADQLPEYIVAVSPMRGKQHLERKKIIHGSYEDTVLSCRKGITCRDRYSVMSSDAILVNLLGSKIVSIGTVMEIAWADILRKPIILVMEKEGNIHEHPIIQEVIGFRVSTIDEGISVADAVLMTGV